ncbi:MAG: histidine kinase [Defluviitaleaceae bacterium]|nr:histidine kinase [Defluviitaleaceae bacterium]
MWDLTTPKLVYIISMVLGFGLLSVRWIWFSVEITGFFLMLFMICMTLLRWRFPQLKWSAMVDGVLCALFYPWALLVVMFAGMYYRLYYMAVLVLIFQNIYIAAAALLAGLCGAFLGLWEKERERGLNQRDSEVERYYELESLQSDLLAATVKIEQMTVVSERARISREIHDNAGHEIVAAYISLQTAREIFDDPECIKSALPLYDAALERLDKGVNKIREAVHNLAPVTMLGVGSLREICERFPKPVDFKVFGDTSKVPVHVWGVLEACLQESLTNVTRHASFAKSIKVNIDTTPNIARLCVENDGVLTSGSPGVGPDGSARPGSGLRNLRHRAAAIGGSLAIDFGEKFRVICVVPIGGIKCGY